MSANPYPGLRPFRADEAHLFFGRESQVDAMVDRLAAAHFLAVVGSSGCGKSSLVSCGLRPALQRGLMSGAGSSWRIASFRPGADPISALAGCLAQPGVLFDAPPEAAVGSAAAVAVSRVALVESTLRLSKRGLVDLIEMARLPAATRLLLVVDQFEELFRYRALAAADTRAAQDAVGLVNLLLEAVQAPEAGVYVVLTMRSDFLGDCTQFNGLAEAINTGQYLVPRMTRDERRAAIAGPAAVAGAVISPTLLTRLVNDVGDNPDQLSILQHALNRTWAAWALDNEPGSTLALHDYEAIGTMAHALDRHAERALADLPDAGALALAERIFKALTDRAADPRGVRRPTRFDTLCAITEATPDAVAVVLAVFRKPSRSFLMPPAGEPLLPETVIDLSHESLMRVWERLRHWTEEESLSAQHYKRVAETAALQAAGSAGLWRDPDLQLALDWRARARPNPAWAAAYAPGFVAATAFLDLSLAEREAEAEFEAVQARQAQLDQAARTKAETQAELQKGYAQTMRRRALLSTTFGVVAICFAAWGELSRRDALVSREQATAAAKEAGAAASAALASRDEALRAKVEAEATRIAYTRESDEQSKLLARAKKIDPSLGQALPAAAALPTLYIQIQSDDQKPWANQLRQAAAARQLKAPGIERVRAGPRLPELRFFREEDRQVALETASWLKAQDGLGSLVTNLVAGLGDRAKAGQMELWYGTPVRAWLVVAGTYKQRDNAETKMQRLEPLGLAAQVIETRDYPNLREGFFAVVLGPFETEARAREQLNRVSGTVKDAYIKSGW